MRVMFLIPGISQDVESPDEWVNKASPVINQRPGWTAQPILYQTDAVTVDAHEDERVKLAAQMFNAYPGCELHAMMHSNGNRVGVSGWQLAGCKFKSFHMLCPAIEADFDTNGLNAGLLSGAIENLYCYWAGKDSAMRIENTLAGDILFGIPLGHKPLGLQGPMNVDPAVKDRVHVIEWPDNDHSTCFGDGYFASTVEQVMSGAETI